MDRRDKPSARPHDYQYFLDEPTYKSFDAANPSSAPSVKMATGAAAKPAVDRIGWRKSQTPRKHWAPPSATPPLAKRLAPIETRATPRQQLNNPRFSSHGPDEGSVWAPPVGSETLRQGLKQPGFVVDVSTRKWSAPVGPVTLRDALKETPTRQCVDNKRVGSTFLPNLQKGPRLHQELPLGKQNEQKSADLHFSPRPLPTITPSSQPASSSSNIDFSDKRRRWWKKTPMPMLKMKNDSESGSKDGPEEVAEQNAINEIFKAKNPINKRFEEYAPPKGETARSGAEKAVSESRRKSLPRTGKMAPEEETPLHLPEKERRNLRDEDVEGVYALMQRLMTSQDSPVIRTTTAPTNSQGLFTESSKRGRTITSNHPGTIFPKSDDKSILNNDITSAQATHTSHMRPNTYKVSRREAGLAYPIVGSKDSKAPSASREMEDDLTRHTQGLGTHFFISLKDPLAADADSAIEDAIAESQLPIDEKAETGIGDEGKVARREVKGTRSGDEFLSSDSKGKPNTKTIAKKSLTPTNLTTDSSMTTTSTTMRDLERKGEGNRASLKFTVDLNIGTNEIRRTPTVLPRNNKSFRKNP